MGNKITRRRPVVDERYTRPQGLYPCRDVDQRKLRRLILDAKLAPCFPGAEEPATDLEECPICFLQYPSLNRSKCCAKGVCTECFLQLKAPHSTRPTQCPFCKTPSYAVEYRGAKTLEEKGLEQAEEQKVIEAKIRMRQQEAQEDEERAKRRKEDLRLGRVRSHHPRSITPVDEPEEDLNWNNVQQVRFGTESTFHERSTLEVDPYQRVDRTAPLQQSAVSVSSNFMPSMNHQQQQQQTEIEFPAPRFPLRREDEFELDLEDIMVMEAIWLSIQEQGARHRFADIVEGPEIIEADVGLAGAIAALAERQAVNQRINTAPTTTRSMHAEANDEQETGELVQENNLPSTSQESEISSSSTRPEPHQEESLMRKNVESNTAPSPSEITCGSNDEVLVPDNFEEQMMLAMALSIARSGPLPQPVQ